MSNGIWIVQQSEGGLEIEVSDDLREIWKLTEYRYDPAICTNFHEENLVSGLRFVNNEAPQPPLPVWFPAGINYPISSEQFKLAVMHRCAMATNGNVIDGYCIAPNNFSEAMGITSILSGMCLDPFIIAMTNAAGGPLARFFAFREPTRRMRGEAINIQVLLLPQGSLQAFI